MLLSHWSIKIWLISPPYLRGLLNTFPKWYDTWNSDENWAFYGQKTEELCFCQKFWKNFRGLFGALKLEIFLKKRYFGVTLDRHYLILRSKSKSKKLTAHLLFFGPLSNIDTRHIMITVVLLFWIELNLDECLILYIHQISQNLSFYSEEISFIYNIYHLKVTRAGPSHGSIVQAANL